VENIEFQCYKLKKMIENSKNTVFFGGAGISVDSGIPDYRSISFDLDNYISPSQILNSFVLYNHPDIFYKYLRDKNLLNLNLVPNKTHYWLAELESNGLLNSIITQNIDGFHTAANSQNVIEVHGSLDRFYCVDCKKNYSKKNISTITGYYPVCDCGGLIRPDIVLYNEPIAKEVETKSIEAIAKSDLIIVGGTSLNVFPVTGYIFNNFRGRSAVIINKSKTAFDKKFSLSINYEFKELLPYLDFGD
jgi:NAD-dependent deacetylase